MNPMPDALTKTARPAPRSAPEDGFAVLDACHRSTLTVVGALEELVATIDRDGITPAAQVSAAAIANFLSTTARAHHEDEELHVFPALLGSADAELVQTVLRLQQDHGWLEEDWLELEPHVQAIATGYGCCDLDTLRLGTTVFAALYRDHIDLEESIAYPQARAQISPAVRQEMGREMAARRRAAARSTAGR
ncbi:hemerythrin domain-containing protein [Methylibium sp.]|uniref:hemerythrin domain-containing protein n=1 Tax=Methylibium sp. TaxID=2067992 RepID=UPI003D0EC911